MANPMRKRWPVVGRAACITCCLLGGLAWPRGERLAWAQAPEEAADETSDDSSAAPRGSMVEDKAAAKLLEAGDARLTSDEAVKAVEIWESVIERYPRSRVRFEAHLRLGSYQLDRERAYDKARSHFEQVAVEENPDEEQRAVALLKVGVCFYEARNYGKSFKVMRDVIEKFPVSANVNQAYYYIGLGHFQLGHYSRAIEALDKVGTAFSGDEGGIEKVEAGRRLFIKIEDADLAVLAQGQTVQVECQTTQGDIETVDCYPVGRNVRLVLGSIPTGLGKPHANNRLLEVRGDDIVTVRYLDAQTADRSFDRKVLREITVVADALVQIMDGAYSETLEGVVLDKTVNVQVADGDLDLTDQPDKLTAIVEVYREKSQEELDAEAAAEASQATTDDPAAAATNAATAADGSEAGETGDDEPQINPYKLIDRIEVQLTEVPTPRPQTDSQNEADPTASPPGAGVTSPASDARAPAESAPAESKQGGRGKASTQEGGKKDESNKEGGAQDTTSPGASAAPATPVDDGTIHSGIFRCVVPLVRSETTAQDDQLQALPGDMIQVTYLDEKRRTEGPASVIAKAECVEGNLGSVRVTRAQISDQELRLRTQLKTASALTNIGNRYKEFGLKKQADAKYAQALQVCEGVNQDAVQLGGHLLEETYVQLWQVYYAMDQLELAAAMAQRLEREFPNSGFVDDALLQLADVARKQGDLSRAVGIYGRLVAMKESQLRGEAQFGIAECYEEMAKAAQGAARSQLYDRAFQEYRLVFDSFPESGRVGEAVAKMANYYYQQKDYARAIDTFETVLSSHPDAKFLDVILFNYGRCLFRMDRPAEARKQFDQLIADFPESSLATDAKKISEALAKSSRPRDTDTEEKQ